MSDTSRSSNEIDDYIAAFCDGERQEYAAAETALDLVSILYHTRQERGLTQSEAAERASLEQQAVDRVAKAASTVQLGRLQRYLGALGIILRSASSTIAPATLQARLRFLMHKRKRQALV